MKLKVVKEFKGGKGKIEGGEGKELKIKSKSEQLGLSSSIWYVGTYVTRRIGTNGGEKMVLMQKCKLGSYAHNF